MRPTYISLILKIFEQLMGVTQKFMKQCVFMLSITYNSTYVHEDFKGVHAINKLRFASDIAITAQSEQDITENLLIFNKKLKE